MMKRVKNYKTRRKLLIIISGPSGTGKTFLSKKIAKKFNLPVIHKDDFKEILFDELGIKDDKWSEELGRASFHLVRFIVEKLLKAGVPHIVEAPFQAKFENIFFKNLEKRYKLNIVQIQLIAQREVIFKRMKERCKKNKRHPGHRFDYNITKRNINKIEESYEPLNVGGRLYVIDTTRLEQVNLNKLYRDIKKYVNNLRSSQ